MDVRLTSEWRAAGIAPSALRRLNRAGSVVRIRHGAYARELDEDPLDRHLTLVRATIPRLHPDCCISHVSAAVVHGLVVPWSTLGRVHVTRSRGSGVVTRWVHRHHAPLESSEVEVVGGLRVTNQLRTVADLARTLSFADAVAVIDAWLAGGGVREALQTHLASAPRRPGNAGAVHAVAFADPLSESPGESRSRALMDQVGLPAPTVQREILDQFGRPVARTDFSWDDYRVVGEFDGDVKYGRLLRPGQSISDVVLAEKRREESIRRQGWWLVRWTNADLREPNEFRRTITAAFGYGPGAGR